MKVHLTSLMSTKLNPKESVKKFFSETASSYDKVVNYTTLGRDKVWKKEILKKIKGDKILDLACGTGILTRMIAGKLPNARIIGVDITQSYLNVARGNSETFENISFINQDAESLIVEERFDCITSSYIPKYCNPKKLVRKCIEHLKSDGMIILHDFTCPKNKIVKKFWTLYFYFLQVVGVIIPEWKVAFRDLPKIICETDWVQEYTHEMKREGLSVDYKYHTFGCCAIVTARSSIA